MEPIVVEVGPSDAAVRIGDLWVYEWDADTGLKDAQSYAVPMQLKLIKRDNKLYADGWAHIEDATFWRDKDGKTVVVREFYEDTREVIAETFTRDAFGTITRTDYDFSGDAAWIYFVRSEEDVGSNRRTIMVGVISHVIPVYNNDEAQTVKHHRVFVTMQGAAKARIQFGPQDAAVSHLRKNRGDARGIFVIQMREQIVKAYDDGEQLRDVNVSRHFLP